MPQNTSTGRTYSGINVLLLWGAVVERGFSGQSWLTFRQALSLGRNVRKGERGTTVVYAGRFVPEDEKRRAHETSEDAQAIPVLKRFTVFNTAPAHSHAPVLRRRGRRRCGSRCPSPRSALRRAVRLARDFSGSFGTKKYAFEELIAEINAAFCCASASETARASTAGQPVSIFGNNNQPISASIPCA